MSLSNRSRNGGVSVQLAGGLGNQLFQLFAGLQQAERLGVNLNLIPPTLSAKNTPRQFELGQLVDRLPNVEIAPRGEKSHYRERDFSYDESIQRIRPGTHLRGYFQSWRYFTDLVVPATQLLEATPDFRAGQRLAPGDERIAVQIRRGDYLIPKIRRVHGILSDEYFCRAVAEVREELGNLKVVVHSDSADTAEQLSKAIPNSEPFQPKGESSLFNLGVLATASAYVISNSSFGWWGAFSSTNNAPLVIAPSKWFLKGSIETSDLLLPAWHQREGLQG